MPFFVVVARRRVRMCEFKVTLSNYGHMVIVRHCSAHLISLVVNAMHFKQSMPHFKTILEVETK